MKCIKKKLFKTLHECFKKLHVLADVLFKFLFPCKFLYSF